MQAKNISGFSFRCKFWDFWLGLLIAPVKFVQWTQVATICVATYRCWQGLHGALRLIDRAVEQMFAVEGWVTGLDNGEWLFRVSASWPSCARWLHQGCWPHCRGKKRALCNRETLRFGRQFKRQTHWCISHFEWFDNAAQQRVGTWALVRLTDLTAFDDGPSGDLIC